MKLPEHDTWQPCHHFWNKNNKGQTDELDDDKGDNSPVDVASGHLLWTDPLQVEKGEAKGRGQERGLKVHGNQDAEPQGIKTKILDDRREDWNHDEGDFDEIQEESQKEQDKHDNCQDAPLPAPDTL